MKKSATRVTEGQGPGPGADRTYLPEVYWEDLLSRDFSLTGVGYLGLGTAYNGWLYRRRRRVFEAAVRDLRLSPGDARVLDLGCGTGFYVGIWNELGVSDLVGIDLTNSSVEELGKQFPDFGFHQSDITRESLPVRPESFDVVTAFDVLFHVVEDVKFENAVRNMCEALEPGGVLLVSDNFPRLEENAQYCMKSHTLEAYRRVFDSQGVEVESVRPVFHLMNAPVDLQTRSAAARLAYRVWWKALRKFVKLGELAGATAGAALFGVEAMLSLFVEQSPTTKLLVARKS